MEVNYAFSCAVENNKSGSFKELIETYRREKLEKAGVNFSYLWMQAAELGHVDIMEEIQRFKLCDKDFQLPGGITAAHVALDQKNPQIEVIRYLVRIGADLTVRRVVDDKTPYELVPGPYREACKLLPEVGPEAEPEPESESTPKPESTPSESAPESGSTEEKEKPEKS